ncbi:MAG: 3'(2'),5'-bisphosphate nucleotidase CysQ [Lentimicrobiaceae bacterium]|jgi:3'(2'), 5'-bisphosphate nucleotidase
MIVTESLIAIALQAAFRAGKAIMDIYSGPFEVELKTDNSPLTIADKTAHSLIAEGLSDTEIPILSEEGTQISYEFRKSWKQFWLVDPLDGTKEFIKKNGDFTVNIALIRDQEPVLGVVFAPVSGFMYWGSQSGSYRLDTMKLDATGFENYQLTKTISERLPCISRTQGYLVLGSRSHMNVETESFIRELQNTHPDLLFIARGSSLKFCILAEGGADIYPRFGPTMEWDIAAGHAVAIFAGCSVQQAENGLPLRYNKPSLLNPNFIAQRKKNEVTNF